MLTLVTMADLLERLPSPDRLREVSVALAVPDVAMSPEDDPDDRLFRFDPRDPSGVALASMDHGFRRSLLHRLHRRRSLRLGLRVRVPDEPFHADTCSTLAGTP